MQISQQNFTVLRYLFFEIWDNLWHVCLPGLLTIILHHTFTNMKSVFPVWMKLNVPQFKLGTILAYMSNNINKRVKFPNLDIVTMPF
jgi:hypothetical protein